MSVDFNGIAQNVQARCNGIQRGFNQAIQTNDGIVDLAGKTAAAAVAAGLFAGIAGASFGTILFVMMITAAAVGAYVSSTYDVASVRGLANSARAHINDAVNNPTGAVRSLATNVRTFAERKR